MWLSAIKLAVSAGSKIYANKQRTKMAMSDAQLMHATKMAQGQEAYQGKLSRSPTIGLERRGGAHNFKFARVSACLGSGIGRSNRYGQGKTLFFDMFSQLPSMVHKFVDPCCCEYIWYKGNANI